MRLVKFILLIFVVLVLAGCSVPELEPQPAATPAPLFGEEVSGYGTWYGPLFHGRVTTSGIAYDMEKLTASHRSYPLGAVVEVTNPDNGRKVKVTINDRHNLEKGIQLCLSKKAAKEIGVYPRKRFKVVFMMIK
jgi:rare lipoprotein A